MFNSADLAPEALSAAQTPTVDPGLTSIIALGRLGAISTKEFVADIDPTTGGYSTQILPLQTQLLAQREAEMWASDTKQVYIAVGYWLSPYLGLVKHVYYSPSRHKKFILYFKVFRGIVQRKVVVASGSYYIANQILRGVQDVYNLDNQAALKRAKMAGYKPIGGVTVGVLIDPVVMGPTWVFLSDPVNQKPRMAVRAKDGMIIREGDIAFEAIKVIVTPSDD